MRSRSLAALTLVVVMAAPVPAHAIPAWARRYNMNCSGCHAPAVPRLNATGYAFKWAGYRMPEEIGEDQEVKQVSDYVALRARLSYLFSKTENEPAAVSGFVLNDATVFGGGAIGKHFGAMFEFEHSAEGVDLMANMVGVWGSETQYVGVRGGQMHWLLEGGVAGFDRATGINTPTPVDGQTTAGNPFSFANDGLGIEAFVVSGKNRLSVELLNSQRGPGVDPKQATTTQDVVVIDQFIYDTRGSGITAAGYFGTVDGLDAGAPLAPSSQYTRWALTANKIFRHAELLGGYVYSKDSRLPVGDTFKTASMTGTGYWVYGGYTLPSSLTVFSRYEVVNPNTDVDGEGNVRWALGGVLPVNIPEYVRLAAEYTLDMPRASGSTKVHGLGIELMFAF